jgi:hypothetical protein
MNPVNELELAEADLTTARRELAAAERKIESAACKIEDVIEKEKHDHPFKVEVSYNGVPKEFEVRDHELVKTLLDRTLNVFGPIPNPHTLSLFNSANVELDDAKTLKAVGVKPGDKLLLRPSKVKGGS